MSETHALAPDGRHGSYRIDLSLMPFEPWRPTLRERGRISYHHIPYSVPSYPVPRKGFPILLVPYNAPRPCGVTGRLAAWDFLQVMAPVGMHNYYCLLAVWQLPTLCCGWLMKVRCSLKWNIISEVKATQGIFVVILRVINSISHRGEAVRGERGETIVMAASEPRTFCHSCIDCRRPPARPPPPTPLPPSLLLLFLPLCCAPVTAFPSFPPLYALLMLHSHSIIDYTHCFITLLPPPPKILGSYN